MRVEEGHGEDREQRPATAGGPLEVPHGRRQREEHERIPHTNGKSPNTNITLTSSGTTKRRMRSSLPTAASSARSARTVPPRYALMSATVAPVTPTQVREGGADDVVKGVLRVKQVEEEVGREAVRGVGVAVDCAQRRHVKRQVLQRRVPDDPRGSRGQHRDAPVEPVRGATGLSAGNRTGPKLHEAAAVTKRKAACKLRAPWTATSTSGPTRPGFDSPAAGAAGAASLAEVGGAMGLRGRPRGGARRARGARGPDPLGRARQRLAERARLRGRRRSSRTIWSPSRPAGSTPSAARARAPGSRRCEREARPDETRFPRAFEVSHPRRARPVARGLAADGRGALRRRDRHDAREPAPAHVLDDLVSMVGTRAHAGLAGRRRPRGRLPVQPRRAPERRPRRGPGVPADRFVCPGGGFVGASVAADHDYHPRRCIYAPPQGGRGPPHPLPGRTLRPHAARAPRALRRGRARPKRDARDAHVPRRRHGRRQRGAPRRRRVEVVRVRHDRARGSSKPGALDGPRADIVADIERRTAIAACTASRPTRDEPPSPRDLPRFRLPARIGWRDHASAPPWGRLRRVAPARPRAPSASRATRASTSAPPPTTSAGGAARPRAGGAQAGRDRRAWSDDHEHPALMKTLFGVSWWLLAREVARLRRTRAPPTASPRCSWRASPLGHVPLRRARLSRRAGVIAAVLLGLMPRVFFNAHLACFDVPIMAMWILCIYVYWRAQDAAALGWAIAAGIVFGLALETKHNAWSCRPSSSRTRSSSSAGRSARAPRRARVVPASLVSMAVLGPLVFSRSGRTFGTTRSRACSGTSSFT